MDRRAGRIVAAFAAPESRLALRAVSRQLLEAVDAECAEQLRVRPPATASRALPLRVLLACAWPGVCADDTRPFVWLQRLLPAGDLPELTPATEEQLGQGPVMDAPRMAHGFEEDWTRAVALVVPVMDTYQSAVGTLLAACIRQMRDAGLDAELAAHAAIALFAKPTGALLSLFHAPDDPQARWIREQAHASASLQGDMLKWAFAVSASERMTVGTCWNFYSQLLDVVSAAPGGSTGRLRLLDRLLYAELCLAMAACPGGGGDIAELSIVWRPMAGRGEFPAEALRIALDPALPPSDIDDSGAEVAGGWLEAVQKSAGLTF